MSIGHTRGTSGSSGINNKDDAMKTRGDFESEYIKKTPSLFLIDPSVVGGGFHK